jgi:hypothetical protein
MSMRSIAPVLTAALMVLMSLNGMLDFGEAPIENENKELLEVVDASYATDPGHMVFAQYITSDNCGFCMSYGSPAHKKLKNDWADTYTYVSLHSANYGNTADAESGNVAPIMAVSHLIQSGGAPKTSFGDDDGDCCDSQGNRIDTTYFKSGCGAANPQCWDAPFSSGGRTHSTVGDYALEVAQSDNGDGTSDITITASYVGAGSAPLSSYTLYAAVTEKVCNSHAYTDGTKGGHCWEAWLLNGGAYVSNSGNVGGGTGFETISLASGSGSASWTVPNSLVAGGSSNMLTVGALYSGWNTSSGDLDVFTASDSSMIPLIDVGIESLTSDNQDGAPGFVPGDILDIEVIVRNRGVDTYSDGGTLSVYLTLGGQDTLIDSTSLNTLTSGGASDMQSFNTTFDTSNIQTSANGHSVLKAVLSGLTDDGNGANNVGISYVAHDFSPSTDAPMAAGQTTIPRGGSLDFDVSGNSRDSVDTLVTMTAEFEVAPAGTGLWASDWVTAPNSVTAAGTQYERYVFTVDPVPSAGSGDYDVRARLTDARGQSSDWRSSSSAFTLMNGLPVVVNPYASGPPIGDCPEWPGVPTVKVLTNERVPLSGLVCDAETPLNQLVITSEDPAFLAWHPASGEVEVEFTSMQLDASGNALRQGISLSIDDGEDVNTGMLQFNVVENGQPRWSSLPATSYDEGGSASVNLAQYLSDSDDEGNSSSVMDLSLSVISIEPAGIMSADIYGYSLTLEAVDEDAFGSVVVTVRATDLDGQIGETVVYVHVHNVNDAPRFDMAGLENLQIQSGQTLEIDLGARLTDVDDDDLEIWTSIAANPPGAAQFNAITGLLTATYQDAGEQTITITATDSHGATGTWQFVIEVVDTLPLAWSIDGVNGDLDIAVVDMTFGNDPTVFVVQISETELSEILISWSICNTQTGVCSDFGEEEPTSVQLRAGYSFGTPPSSGMGVANFDQLKVDVKAVDSNGFNRESDYAPFDASEAGSGEDVTPPVDDDPKEENGGNEESGAAGSGLSGPMLGIIVGLTILIVIAGMLAAMLLRGGREDEPGFDWGTEATIAVPGAETAPVMAVAAAAPETDVVVDYTHLPVGGQYISGHEGETVYLAPNGTAWTMQADNSFVRTA